MTQNQLAYQANLIKQLEAATNAYKAKETERHNLMDESLTNRENFAKYGANRYATVDDTLKFEPWLTQKIAGDTVRDVLQTIGSIFGVSWKI